MFNYDVLPEHMREGMRRYIERGIKGGDFMTAVLSNDLMGALETADRVNRERLLDYGKFLRNEAPWQCHGSPDKVAAWIDRGGMSGNDQLD